MLDESAEWTTDFLMAEGDNPNDMYKDILSQVIEKGTDISPRDLATFEVRPATIIFLKPQERMLTCPGRHIHPFFQIMESIWIMGGRGDAKFITYYLENMRKYTDGQGMFHAPYGVRMRWHNRHRDQEFTMHVRDQFRDCFDSLMKDSQTRQAVMTFWNPSYDNYEVSTTDRPCNIAFQFIIRGGKLHFTVFNRSNDVNFGLFNTNVVQFSVMLEMMAMVLDIPVGTQTHMINSLHVYDFQGPITERVMNNHFSFDIYNYVSPLPFTMDSFADDPHGKLRKLNGELDLFFECEEVIRNGSFGFSSPPELTCSFLIDALCLARSFARIKKEKYLDAAMHLIEVKDSAIFISCCEYLVRASKDDQATIERVMEMVNSRFRSLPDFDSLKAVIRFIVEH